MKRSIKKIIEMFGYEVKKIDKKRLNFDDIYKMFFKDNLIIFDVGANKGQSIERFKKIFPLSTIHAFEPIKKEYDFIKNYYEKQKEIFINNYALGENEYDKELNLSKRTGVSSFNNFNLEHEWIKTRSRQYNTDIKGFLDGKEKVKVETLDNYCKKKSIKNIDILKIDTQGYEEKILFGAKNLIGSNSIKAIELEIIFDDTYDKYLSFSDIEKFLLPNFRFSGIKNYNQNLFEGINFFAEVLYLNKNIIKDK